MYTSTRTAENFYFFGDTPQGKGYADKKKSSDYTPYGTLLHHRHGQESTTDYRYGFNGMEADDDVKGEGNSYTTEFRQYDPRIGRWLSLDPLMAKYPDHSPFTAFNNSPIYYSDPTGLEGDPPAGLPSDPTDGSVHKADNGRSYIWLLGDEGNGSWAETLEEVTVSPTFTPVKAPPGYGTVVAVGGIEFYIKSTKGAKYANQDVSSLGIGKGEIIQFRAGGRKYKAEFDEYGDFQGYFTRKGSVFKPHFMVGTGGTIVYTANSIQTLAGRDDGNNYAGNFNGIVDMSFQDLEVMIAYGICVIDIWSNEIKEQTVMAESVGGDLDFKNVLYEQFGWNREALINFRGTIYNANEIGNLVWAVVLTYEGVFVDPAFLANEATNRGGSGLGNRNDEGHEQRAINEGVKLGNKITGKKWTAAINGWIPMFTGNY